MSPFTRMQTCSLRYACLLSCSFILDQSFLQRIISRTRALDQVLFWLWAGLSHHLGNRNLCETLSLKMVNGVHGC